MNDITLEALRRDVEERIKEVAAEEANQQARLIVCHALDLSLADLITLKDRVLFPDEQQKVNTLVLQRLRGAPLQYILGSWEFMGLHFITDNRALIPRQDTEVIAEYALAYAKTHDVKTVLDLCCGGGAIGISLASLGKLSVTLSDISDDACMLTRENAKLNRVTSNVTVIKSDMFDAIAGAFDMITVNPPYLTEDDIAKMQKELSFEPIAALYGGTDGLDFYRLLERDFVKYLNPHGVLIMEVGASQADDVTRIFGCGEVIKDTRGLNRAVVVTVSEYAASADKRVKPSKNEY